MATTAKKSTKKKIAKKKTSSTKIAGKTAARRILTPIEKIRSINLSLALQSLFFVILTLIFVGPSGGELLLGHSARDLFANLDSVVLGTASESLFSLEYRYILIAALLISGVGSALLATKLRKRYEATVKDNVSGFRWVFAGVSAALILNLVSFMAGVTDVMTLKVICGLTFASALFAWLSERENVNSKKPKWLAYGASLYAGILAGFPLVGSLVGTTIYGDERFAWHIYGLSGVLLLGFIAYAWNHFTAIKNKNTIEYTTFEQRYLRIDQFAKFLIVLIIFWAIAQ